MATGPRSTPLTPNASPVVPCGLPSKVAVTGATTTVGVVIVTGGGVPFILEHDLARRARRAWLRPGPRAALCGVSRDGEGQYVPDLRDDRVRLRGPREGEAGRADHVCRVV